MPRRRVDPDVLRDRLRALASGEAATAATHGLAALGLHAGHDDGPEPEPAHVVHPEGREDADRPPVVPPGRATAPLRTVVVAVAATALAAWAVVHLTSGGAPSPIELLPGSPLPSVSGVLSGPTGSSAAVAGADPSPSEAVVVVQVLGQVRHPGLVTLPLGCRVGDAVAAAGGLARGGSSGGLNLARVLVDGEQILVSRDSVAAPSPTGSAGGAAVVVDLNSATAADLDSLPGVGPVMAGRILDWRTAHGRFTSVDQLREVSGIGARTFQRLKPLVRV